MKPSEKLDSFLQADVRRVSQMPIIPGMLESVCKATGMGFAAVARVTDTRWIACSVRDEINFGLEAGGELELETTICNEIRQHQKEVVIDHVSLDTEYCSHHTPKRYGFESYISVPIVRRDGEFFGTLCAIDPKPCQLDHVRSMFRMYAELIAFHLDSIEVVEKSKDVVDSLSLKLDQMSEENDRYQFISYHHLQEPLRKIRLFSDRLVQASDNDVARTAKTFAPRINALAESLSSMIKEVSAFSEIVSNQSDFVLVDLNVCIDRAIKNNASLIMTNGVTVTVHPLPTVEGDHRLLEIIFNQIVSHVVLTMSGDAPHSLVVKSVVADEDHSWIPRRSNAVVVFEISNHDMELSELHELFNLLNGLAGRHRGNETASSMALVKKIIRLHSGSLSVERNEANALLFTLTLPMRRPDH